MKVVKNSPEVRKLYRQSLKWHNENFDKLTGIKKVGKKMKLFTPENQETYRIKKIVSAIKKAIVHLNIVAVVLIFISCGSDDIMNNGSNPPVSNDSLVFTIDSLAVYGMGVNSKDTTLFNIFNIGDSVKVVFTAETNCILPDTAYATGYAGNNAFGVLNNLMPNSFTFYGRSVSNDAHFMVYIKSTTNRYIRMKNIKMYKVNPV